MDAFNDIDLNITPEEEDLSLHRLFTLINLDELFAQTPDAKIINNDTLVSQKLSKEFTDALYSNSDGELGFVPSCQCGKIKGTSKIGLLCPQCGTECSEQFIDALSHVSWIAMPEQMCPVLHPVWYFILKTWTVVGKKERSIIDIILNPDEEIPEDLQTIILGRGFKYFYEHHEEILNSLLYKYQKTAKKSSAKWIEIFREVYSPVMFTRHLPILHSSLHPLKCNGSTLNFVDATSKEILSAIIDLSTESFKMHSTTVSTRSLNRTMYDIYSKVMAYYKALIDEKLGGKNALLRKHCFGTRVHFSLRSVIVPQDRVLPMDHIVLPWSTIVSNLKLPIMNLLMNKHFLSFNDAIARVTNAVTQFDELVDQCIQDYIYNSLDHKISLIMGRNPTLTLGSIIMVYVDKWGYKKNPDDDTISVNACVIRQMNAVKSAAQVVTFEMQTSLNCWKPTDLGDLWQSAAKPVRESSTTILG